MRRLFILIACSMVVGVTACAPQAKIVRPDWQNPSHRLVHDQIVPLLRTAGKNPTACKVFFIDTEKMNALSAGECKFGFTTGLVDTGDAQFIRGIAAHEVAHEVLGHADKRKAAIATEQVIRTGVSLIPGVGGLIATGVVLVAGMVALPAYSRSQEADADLKAVEILKGANDPDPAGTMAYSFRSLLARYGAKGGGILDTHPGTEDRLEAMLTLQRQQPPVEPTPRSEIVKAPAPSVEASITQNTLSPSTSSQENSPERPPRDASTTGATAKTEVSSESTAVAGVGMVTVPSLHGALETKQNARGVMNSDEISQQRQTTVMLIYREGSPYSKRVEELLRRVVERFADRVTFLRSEISETDPGLLGADTLTTPILIVFRNGKEQARAMGVPDKRHPAATLEEAIADWLTDCLNRGDN